MKRFPVFENVAIAGLARDTAPEAMSSSAIEAALAPARERLSLPAGLLAGLTGIGHRRLYPMETMASQAAARAAEALFARAAFNRDLIDLLYSTSVCRDYVEPATAAIVQWRLGLGARVKSLDIGSACLGFMDGLELAAIQIEHGLADHALVVAGENSRPLLAATVKTLLAPDCSRTTFFRNFASLTLGSGGAAMILGRADRYPAAPRLRAAVSLSDAAGSQLCRGDQTGMETDSVALMTTGIALAKKTFEEGAKQFGWTRHGFAALICHQVSEVNTKKFCQALGLPEERLVKTFPDYGNMGPVAVPFTLDVAREQGLIRRNDRLCLMGIGSGLCSTMMEVLW